MEPGSTQTLSQQLKFDVVRFWYSAGCKSPSSEAERYRIAVGLFETAFPERIGHFPSKTWILKFVAAGEAGDLKEPGKRGPKDSWRVTEEKRQKLAEELEASCHVSVRDVSKAIEVSPATAWRLLKKEKFKMWSYHPKAKLDPLNPSRRLDFCNLLLRLMAELAINHKKILFTDETYQPLVAKMNSRNKMWSKTAPSTQETIVEAPKYPVKLSVWGGFMSDYGAFGPYFFTKDEWDFQEEQRRKEANQKKWKVNGSIVTSRKYLKMLQEYLIPEMRSRIPETDWPNIWFQQDGSPAHITKDVTNYLQSVFQHRIISRRDHNSFGIDFPPNSPDLTCCDYSAWGYMKRLVSSWLMEQKRVNVKVDISMLKAKTESVFASWNHPESDFVRKMIDDQFPLRLKLCKAQGGNHFIVGRDSAAISDQELEPNEIVEPNDDDEIDELVSIWDD